MIGKIEPFNVNEGSWLEYTEILGQFFIVNDVYEKKRAVLFSCIGGSAYALLRDFCSPALPSTKTYAYLVSLMSTRLSRSH